MDAVAMVEDEGLWKFDQPKWYEALGEAIAHLIAERRWSNAAQPSEPPAPDALREVISEFIGGIQEHIDGSLAPEMSCVGCMQRLDRLRAALAERETKALAASPSSDLRTWITGAQFMVTPKEAPDGDAPLHVVTVEGVLKWLDEREAGR